MNTILLSHFLLVKVWRYSWWIRGIYLPYIRYFRMASLNIEAETKWPPFSIQHIQMNFLKWEYMSFDENSLKFVTMGPTNNIPALVEIMDWRRPGANAFSQPMMVTLLMHICVTRRELLPRVNAGGLMVNNNIYYVCSRVLLVPYNIVGQFIAGFLLTYLHTKIMSFKSMHCRTHIWRSTWS